MAEIKSCPFCGATPSIVTRNVVPQGDPWYGSKNETFVLCDCGACLFDGDFHEGFWDAETRAVEAWNRRTSIGDTPAPQSTDGAYGVAGTVQPQQAVECAFCERPMIAGSECLTADQAAACEVRAGVPPSEEAQRREELSRTGHGHVAPRTDGAKARCGGVMFCDKCKYEREYIDAARGVIVGGAEHGQDTEQGQVTADLLIYRIDHAYISNYNRPGSVTVGELMALLRQVKSYLERPLGVETSAQPNNKGGADAP